MKLKNILLFLSIFFLVVSLLSFLSQPLQENHSQNRGYSWEDYDPAYFTKFQDVQSVIDTADKHFRDQSNPIAYFDYIATILRKRFYHGFSHYSFSDNPFASIAGNIVWDHLSAIVIPDDIMKHPSAACSQQAIVMMEIFRRKGVSFRRVGLKNHYCVEALINNEWVFFDTNMEPSLRRPVSLNGLINRGTLKNAYSEAEKNNKPIQHIFSEIQYGPVNESPAPQATFFHKCCYLLKSGYFFLLLLLVVVLYVTGLPVLKKA